MKHALMFLFLAISLSSYSEEIHKWTDDNGTVHFGSKPPTGKQSEVISTKKESPEEKSDSDSAPTDINTNFLLGRWQSEQYSAYGTIIPAQVYVFSGSSQGVEGKEMTMPVRAYTVKGKVITLEGAIKQEFTVVDNNTVTFDSGGAGIKKLRRL